MDNIRTMRIFRGIAALLFFCVLSPLCMAGPPYVTDDPEPTDYQHFEIYAFDQGTNTKTGGSSSSGIDFNYGAAPDLQLTAVMPVEFESPVSGKSVSGMGNIELAAKYRFLHQDGFGWDVSVFPRVFLPSASAQVGEHHASLLLPFWVEKDWGAWSSFGGGGCAINESRDAKDYCLMGWALTRQLFPNFQVGAEIYHQTADAKGGRATTGIGGGIRYDFTDHYHLLAYAGPGIQNMPQTDRMSWYTSILFTF